MGINAQAGQVGTGRGAGSSVTMWIVVSVVVVSMAIAGIAMALRNETATPSREVVPSVTNTMPSVTQRAPSVKVPVDEDPSAGTAGGYILENGVCHQCL